MNLKTLRPCALLGVAAILHMQPALGEEPTVGDAIADNETVDAEGTPYEYEIDPSVGGTATEMDPQALAAQLEARRGGGGRGHGNRGYGHGHGNRHYGHGYRGYGVARGIGWGVGLGIGYGAGYYGSDICISSETGARYYCTE